ncbi:VTT domain-containing protein [Streptomyces sp900116325]|uniref:TVP38/TMEM64 family protein n=1 Tax=unclassified Streptomyces TaxID=2593676 RepID=UPI0033AE393B
MPAPASSVDGLVARLFRAMHSPWSRLAILVALLAGAALLVLVWQPQQELSSGSPAAFSFMVAYGLCAAAFVPRPLLNVAAGALLGVRAGTAAALAGTVLAATISFGLGRLLGRDALRPMWRGRFLAAADRQLSDHGFRTMLGMRLFPGIPFLAATYCAAVSSVGWLAFLLATVLGSVPNTAAYVIAGAHATAPASPVFLVASGFLAITGLATAVVAWRARGRLHRNR